MYNLQKWYFDFLTPQNDFVFVYFASVRLARMALHSLVVHLARPDKKVFRTQAIPIPRNAHCSGRAGGSVLRLPDGQIESKEPGWVLDFAASDCSVQLRYEETEETNSKPVIISTGRRSSILWKPLGLNYAVSGVVKLGDETIEVQGVRGYVDYLQSNCLPPLVPIRTLYWGRFNQPQLQLVFMRATNGAGTRAWSGLYGRAGSAAFESDCVSLQNHDSTHTGIPMADGEYELSAAINPGEIRLTVHHTIPVQQGGFIDQQTTSSPLVRALLRLLTRDPHSTKFLSSADLSLDLPGRQVRQLNLPLIDEIANL